MDSIFEHVPRLGIMQIFDNAQNSYSGERLLKNLFNIFKNNNHSQFILEFLQCLAVCMVQMEKQLSTERLLDFAAKYCIYHSSLVDEENNVLLLAVFEFIFNNHNRKTPAVRFRTCEFVNRLLNKMGPQASLDDDIFQKMATTMLERLQDKLPSVRAQAVMALQRLQDPPNKNCKIIRAFMFHMETDPSCEVRTKIVQSIAVTQKTLPLLLGRLQDVKETVRKEAYRSLTRLKPRKLSILQRQSILTSGLSDRSDSVKNFVIDHVIPNWFRNCDSNLVDFLKILDVVSFQKETASAVLRHVFKDIPTSELVAVIERLQVKSEGQKLIPVADLTPETATIWAGIINNVGFDSCDDAIIPELSYFAKYIKKYGEEADLKDTDHQYVLTQLFQISKCYSFMDEMGRKQLTQTCLDLLKDDGTGTEVIPPIVKLLELLMPIVKQRMIVMAELITDIREPLDTNDLELNQTSDNTIDVISEGLSQLNCTSQSLDDCIRTERTDPETLVKCLMIVVEMLRSPSVNKVDPTLLSLKEHFILLCFKVDDGRVQSLALDALALLCYWSLDLAKEYFLKFCIQITDDATCISAVEAVFDLVLIHGFDAFTFGWDDSDTDRTNASQSHNLSKKDGPLNFENDKMITSPVTRKLVSLLTNLLTSNVNEVKCKASQGLCKLLLSSRLDSYVVLSHLIILWFSSASDSDPYIRQPLGLFFSVFSKRAGAAEIILSAFSPTLQKIEELVEEDIDSMKVANLFITLLRSDISGKMPNPKEEEGKWSYHARLALIVLDEVRFEVIQQQVLMKTLSSLQFEDSDAFLAKELESQAHKVYKWLQKRSGEKRSINIIKKFRDEMAQLKAKHKVKDFSEIVEEIEASPNMKEVERKEKIKAIPERVEDVNDGPTTSHIVEGDENAKEETLTKGNEVDLIEAKEKGETTLNESSQLRKEDTDLERIVDETSESSEDSEEIVTPSPPKRRMLRSQKK